LQIRLGINFIIRGLKMITKDLAKCSHFRAMDNTRICELLHPEKDLQGFPYSIAHAVLEPEASSLPHRLTTSTEVYFILKGIGEIHIDSEQAEVHPGQAIVILPGSWQHICNNGRESLEFLCIVHPAWQAADEELGLENDQNKRS
jgi:mannose-6-phosphate isomerase-like protein (cupin superfamily)